MIPDDTKNSAITKYVQKQDMNITYAKKNPLEDLVRGIEKLQQHSTFINEAADAIKNIMQKEETALDNKLMEKALKENFGDATYNTLRGLYQKIVGTSNQ